MEFRYSATVAVFNYQKYVRKTEENKKTGQFSSHNQEWPTKLEVWQSAMYWAQM